MKYEISLDSYEGPLDLLLQLIDEAEVDIYDIPINLITEQYMEYIYAMEEMNLEIASDFILMASTLLEIKSRMLLPEEKDEDDEEIDPREELIQRLLEYKKYKDAANKLEEKEDYGRKAYYKPQEDLSVFVEEEVDLGELDLDIILKSINNIIREKGISEEIESLQEIRRDKYSVKECSANIVEALNDGKSVKLTELLSEDVCRNEIVTYFLSILELIKVQMIKVKQVEDFSDLIIEMQE